MFFHDRELQHEVTDESGGRILAIKLYSMTDEAGMDDYLSYLIARDTMHQE